MKEEIKFKESELEALYKKMLISGTFDKLKKIDEKRNGLK